MTELNKEQLFLLKKMKELENKFKYPPFSGYLDCYDYLTSYNMLKKLLGKDITNKNIADDFIINFLSISKGELLVNKTVKNIIDSKYEHSILIKSFMNDVNDIFVNYLENTTLASNSKISVKEEKEILMEYLKTDGKDLYNKTKGKIHFLNPSKLKLDQEASDSISIYLPLTDEGIITVCNLDNKVSKMGALIHELGHTEDWFSYRKLHSRKSTSIYAKNIGSLYSEVKSTYNEYKFYDYLLKNNIYLTDTLTTLALVTNEYFNSLDYASLIGYIPSNFLKADSLIVYKEDLRKSTIKMPEVTPYLKEMDDEIPFDDALTYSYGMMLSFAMLENPDLYDKFEKLQEPFFHKEKLDKVGFTDEVIAKSMVKRMNKYFKI